MRLIREDTEILITGSEGNVGRVLVPHLKSRGYNVKRCDIQNYRASDYAMIDVKSPGDLGIVFRDFEPDIVIHLGAVVSRVTAEASPHLTVDTNVSGTHNLIQLCRAYEAKLVYFSTSEVYGNTIQGEMSEFSTPRPNNRYGLSKYLGEILVNYEVKNYSLNALIIRPFMLYDEGETRGVHRSAMVRFAEALSKGESIVVHRGARRSWLHMDDAVEIIESLLPYSGIVNIGNPDLVSMLDLAKLMCDWIGCDYSLITEADLPLRMTLCKQPGLTRQRALTGKEDFISVEEGMSRLMDRLRGDL